MSTSLSNKLISDYNILADEYLDKIPLSDSNNNNDHIQNIKSALNAILEPEKNHTIVASLKDRIESIKDLLDHPECYVSEDAHYKAFKNIIRNRIIAKINLLSDPTFQIEKNIKEQDKEKKTAQEYQNKIKNKTPPNIDSESHVLSEMGWLAYEQNRFYEEWELQNLNKALPNVTLAELKLLHPERRRFLLENPLQLQKIKWLLKYTSLSSLAELNSYQWLQTLQYHDFFTSLMSHSMCHSMTLSKLHTFLKKRI